MGIITHQIIWSNNITNHKGTLFVSVRIALPNFGNIPNDSDTGTNAIASQICLDLTILYFIITTFGHALNHIYYW